MEDGGNGGVLHNRPVIGVQPGHVAPAFGQFDRIAGIGRQHQPRPRPRSVGLRQRDQRVGVHRGGAFGRLDGGVARPGGDLFLEGQQHAGHRHHEDEQRGDKADRKVGPEEETTHRGLLNSATGS